MGKRSPLSFLADQFSPIPSVVALRADLSARTIIVVGASSGIGLELARHLASLRPGRLILACRNTKKGEDSLEYVRRATQFEGGEVWALDLNSFASIRAFADRFEREGRKRLDLLVLNAGINTEKFSKTEDGYESVLQTNHIGTSFLSILLLPYLVQTPPSTSPTLPRLVVVSTDGHYWATMSPEEIASDDLMHMISDEKYCNAKVMSNRYGESKLINLLFVRSLASRLSRPSPIIVALPSPGWCRSSLNRDLTFPLSLIAAALGRVFGRSAGSGARVVLHACVGACAVPAEAEDGLNRKAEKGKRSKKGDGREMHGKFLATCKIREESDFAMSGEGRAAEERIWDQTIAILGQADSRVNGIVNAYLTGH